MMNCDFFCILPATLLFVVRLSIWYLFFQFLVNEGIKNER
ncbi:hypothetical protein HMPREF0083_03476 [Aneurinibacillus aneurinilyticus ATCC 12856]|uniref:Uncharacterized protein n=1 Tax=Aneurinibacillus aneurinilyticus ATCC 12856 TaxID=649747 RepID=U1WIP7_ANEAE|nr:hypothetical protein HMPREF0083_03476 [Aneurinibacillus aneurinilyticus ATCC 12856]